MTTTFGRQTTHTDSKIDALAPASVGHNLVVHVLACDVVVDRRRVDGTPAKCVVFVECDCDGRTW